MRRARPLLLPFSLFYWFGVVVRNWFFDIGFLKSEKVTVPVISVGNISAGGVGKTPVVELLIEKLGKSSQLSVVSRGYGRKSTGTVVVSDGRGTVSSAENSGDEPIQLARKFPELLVVVDEQRVRGARKAIELDAAIILLDDGFQHRYIFRDLDIVVCSAEEILNGELLIPDGNRREPFASVKRADLIVVTRCADMKEYERICAAGRTHKLLPANTPTVGLKTKLKAYKRGSDNEIVKSVKVMNKKVVAFSGIGNSKSFDDLLMHAGITIEKHLIFSDHHWYNDGDIRKIIDARNERKAEFILTTEKDAQRIRERFEQFLETEPVIVAEIQQEIISGGQTLDALLKKIQDGINGNKIL